ncbi:MAG: hypothetical protein Q9211_005497, partial [Gyalolechia sp. 1 TL-2023]
APGMIRSWDVGGGAREAMVDVKERSRVRMLDIRLFKESSVKEEYAWRVRRARRIWEARRSVGVGDMVVDGRVVLLLSLLG